MTNNNVSISTEKDEDQLIVTHLYLVKFVVSRMTMNLPPGLTRDDLHAIGSMGLIDAAKKFDVSKGVQFKTYSVTRIRGAILDELRRYTLGGQTLCRKARQIEHLQFPTEKLVHLQDAFEIAKNARSFLSMSLTDDFQVEELP